MIGGGSRGGGDGGELMITGMPCIGIAVKCWTVAKDRHDDDVDEMFYTHSTAIGHGSNVYVLQRFTDYEHFGFQGLHVANGWKDRSFHLTEGSVPT